jgi:hypothetical protein
MLPVIAFPRPQDPTGFPPVPGDVVFRSRATESGLAEHSAILYEASGDSYVVLALPESQTALGKGLRPQEGLASDWILRARAMTESDGIACVYDLASASGEFHGQPASWFYEAKFHLFQEPGLGMSTNCVGFVASALACCGVNALVPEYSFAFHTPLIHPIRRKPTPGHLARALSGTEMLPFKPNQERAVAYASCTTTFDDALQGALP